MNGMWQRFIRTFEDAETAGYALLVAILAVIGSFGLLAYWLANGRYTAAVGLSIGLGGTTAICVRDFRRGRSSFLSRLAMGIWLLLIAAAMAYAAWHSWRV